MARFKASKRNRSAAIGIAFGLLCAICIGIYIMHVDEQANAKQAEMLAKYGGDQIDVCVAKRDIVAGSTILDGDIETKTWIATLLPANAMTEKSEVVGKRVGSTILAGEVISESRFGFESADIDVPDGFVAVSVPSREVQAVGGAIAAGMATDVYAVGASSTTRIAAAVQVLATSMSSDSTNASASAWITLAVKPEIVQELVSAAETMEIYFTLPSEGVLAADNPETSAGDAAPESGAENETDGKPPDTAESNDSSNSTDAQSQPASSASKSSEQQPDEAASSEGTKQQSSEATSSGSAASGRIPTTRLPTERR